MCTPLNVSNIYQNIYVYGQYNYIFFKLPYVLFTLPTEKLYCISDDNKFTDKYN